MRKIILLTMCLSLVLGVCACRTKGNEKEENKKEEDVKIESSVDEENNESVELEDVQEDVDSEEKQEAVDEEFVPVDITFTFDGAEFKLPSTVGAFVDAGWKMTVTSEDKIALSKNNDDDTIIAHIHEINTENFKESIIDSFYISKSAWAEKPVDLLIDGLKFREATVEQIIEKYGEPDEKKTGEFKNTTIKYTKSNLQFVFDEENKLTTFLYEYEL